LSLAEIKKGHNGGLLVLRRIALHDFLNSLLVGIIECKRDARIVLSCVAVLKIKIISSMAAILYKSKGSNFTV
jgi:hypothetical protein